MSLLGAMETTGLRWHYLPPLWVIVLVLIPGVFLLVRFMYKREAGRVGKRPRMILGTLRALAILLVLAALFGPYSETVKGEYFKRHLIVCLDTSRSMSFRDGYAETAKAQEIAKAAGLPPGVAPSTKSRLELAKGVFTHDRKLLTDLADRFRLHVYTFDEALAGLVDPKPDEKPSQVAKEIETKVAGLQAKGSVTRIGAAIRDLVRTYDAMNEPVAGILLLTDGRHTGGAPSPVEEARRAAEGTREGIPIYPVAIGDRSAAINVGVSRVDAPEVVLAGDEVSFRASVHARGFAGKSATLEAIVLNPDGSDGERLPIAAEPFELPENGKSVDAGFRYRFDRPGTYDLKIGVPPLPGEVVSGDNYQKHTLRVAKLKVRVLLVTSAPNWTWRELYELLLRSEDTIAAQILQLNADPGKPQEASRGLPPLKVFPQSASELARYDVIILMDVDPSDPLMAPGGEATREKVMGNLENWVTEGGGLILQAGRSDNFTEGARGTHLLNLLPVVPGDAARLVDIGIRHKKWFQLTPAGKNSPILRILQDPSKVDEFWDGRDYANFYYWYAPVERAKSGSTVLAVRREDPNLPYKGPEDPPNPLIAVQPYGNGKVLWLGTDEWWRMKKGVRDLYFWRFWSGAIRQLATYRLLGGNKRIKIFLDKSNGRYQVGEPISIEAKFLDEDFKPVVPTPGDPTTQTKTLRLKAPDGKESDVVLQAVPEEPPRGIYRARLVAGSPGTYRIFAPPEGGEEPAERTFVVADNSIEMEDPLMDWSDLVAIARASGGEVILPSKFEEFVKSDRLSSRGVTRTGERETTDLWDRSWVLLLFVGLLAAEWILRRVHLLL